MWTDSPLRLPSTCGALSPSVRLVRRTGPWYLGEGDASGHCAEPPRKGIGMGGKRTATEATVSRCFEGCQPQQARFETLCHDISAVFRRTEPLARGTPRAAPRANASM